MTVPVNLLQGKYEVLAKLREGGMGAIYKVRHLLLDDVRIVKVMRPHVAQDEELSRRFESEAKLAIRVRHPNIAHLLDYSVDADGTALIVMEFIDGVTLQDLIARGRLPSIGLAVEIARQSLTALNCLHRNGIVHRDVSSDNLMLTRSADGGPQVKLIDLGIAKDRQSGATATGVFLGKMRYAAPEQFSRGGTASLEPVADVYSFGVVLYELLTGKLPVDGDSFASIVSGHLLEPPIPFDQTDPQSRVPAGLRDVVMQALEKDPAQRIRSTTEFIDLLQPFVPEVPPVEEFERLMPTPAPSAGTIRGSSEIVDMLVADSAASSTLEILSAMSQVRARETVIPAIEATPPVSATAPQPTGAPEPPPTFEPAELTEPVRLRAKRVRREPPPARSWPGILVGSIGAVVLIAVVVVVALIVKPRDDGSLARLSDLEQDVRAMMRLAEIDLGTLESKQGRLDALGSELNNFRVTFSASDVQNDPRIERIGAQLELQSKRLTRLVDLQEKIDLAEEIDESVPGATLQKEIEYGMLVQRLDDFMTAFPDDATGLRMHGEAFRRLEEIRSLNDEDP